MAEELKLHEVDKQTDNEPTIAVGGVVSVMNSIRSRVGAKLTSDKGGWTGLDGTLNAPEPAFPDGNSTFREGTGVDAILPPWGSSIDRSIIHMLAGAVGRGATSVLERHYGGWANLPASLDSSAPSFPIGVRPAGTTAESLTPPWGGR